MCFGAHVVFKKLEIFFWRDKNDPNCNMGRNTLKVGPYAQGRAVRSKVGRSLKAGQYAQGKAVRSKQGRMLKARPYVQ